MQKLLSKQHPEIMEEKFPLCYNESINNSEHIKLILPYYRTSLGTSSLHYQGCKIWNEITKSHLYLTIFYLTK